MLFLFKLTLAPLLVALATFVSRRWGPMIGGVVVGLPLSTGPIFLFLAIDQGIDFAKEACTGILIGLVGLAGFALSYALASRRTGWAISLLMSAVAYFLVSMAVSNYWNGGVIEAGIAAYVALVASVCLIRRPRLEAIRSASPWWDIWFRMIAAGGLTLAITMAAGRLGPTLSGIVGTYPVVSTVVMTFTHHQFGPEAAVAMLRGTVLSWIAFVSSFLAIGLSLQSIGLAGSLSLGVIAAACTAVLVLRIDRFLASQKMAYDRIKS